MNVPDDDGIEGALRHRLLHAVPPLLTPTNRLGELTTRLHRHRRRAAFGAAVAVLVLLSGSGHLLTDRTNTAPGQSAPSSPCVTLPALAAVPRFSDRPGPLVPLGASSVTRCKTRSASSTVPPEDPLGGPSPVGVGSWLLTIDVDQFATALNTLPPVVGDALFCFQVGYDTDLSFVFTFADQPPLTVRDDTNCGLLITTDRTRSYRGSDPSALFDALYSAQDRSHG